MKLFSDKPWHRGNLHTHTTVSDGRKTPEECIRAYREEGYDFLAITDHRIFTEGYETPDFVLIPGAEYDLNDFETHEAFHILGLGISGNVTERNDLPPQTLIDGILEKGGMPVLAHPGWSLQEHASARELHGYEAMEIYNGVSDYYSGRGDYSNYTDVIAARGTRWPLLATDDDHFYELDFAAGWIMLQTDDFTIRGILDAIRAKHFYATQGPAIRQITVDDDGVITADTSPVREIRFYSDAFFSDERVARAEPGKTIEHAVFHPNQYEHWVRVEGIDENGKHCWSNYIDL